MLDIFVTFFFNHIKLGYLKFDVIFFRMVSAVKDLKCQFMFLPRELGMKLIESTLINIFQTSIRHCFRRCKHLYKLRISIVSTT